MDEKTIEELVRAKMDAKDTAAAFGDAIKEQAKKHKIKKGALRRYIAARADDKLADVRAETAALADLIG